MGVFLRKKYLHFEFFWSIFSRIETEYRVSLCIQSECGKIRARETLNTDTFSAVFTSENKLFYVTTTT